MNINREIINEGIRDFFKVQVQCKVKFKSWTYLIWVYLHRYKPHLWLNSKLQLDPFKNFTQDAKETVNEEYYCYLAWGNWSFWTFWQYNKNSWLIRLIFFSFLISLLCIVPFWQFFPSISSNVFILVTGIINMRKQFSRLRINAL